MKGNDSMTQRDFYKAVMEAEVSQELKDFAESAIAKLDAKNAKRATTPTKKQIENIEISNKILEYISGTENGALIVDIAAALEISKPKASALCVQMVNSGKLIDTTISIKGKGKFKRYSILEA